MKDRNNYSIGYGKPPEHGRFRPGKSGNPRGRPKKEVHGFHDLLCEEFLSLVSVRIDNKQKKLRKIELLVKQMIDRSIKGDMKMLKLLLDTPAFRSIAENPTFRTLNGAQLALIESVRQQALKFLEEEKERHRKRPPLED